MEHRVGAGRVHSAHEGAPAAGSRVRRFSRLSKALEPAAPTRLDLVIPRSAEATGRDLAERETACCAFFDFQFDSAGTDVVMHVSVPPGAFPCSTPWRQGHLLVRQRVAQPLGGGQVVLDELAHHLAGRLDLVHHADALADEVGGQRLRARVALRCQRVDPRMNGSLNIDCSGSGNGFCPPSLSCHASVHSDFKCRAGFPVRPADRMVSRDVAASIFCTVCGAVSASSVVSHTEPVHAPSAPIATAQPICLPVTIPPAASTGTAPSIASITSGMRTIVVTSPQ